MTPTFVAITGPGYLERLGTKGDCVTNSSVWITNVVATAQTNGTTEPGVHDRRGLEWAGL